MASWILGLRCGHATRGETVQPQHSDVFPLASRKLFLSLALLLAEAEKSLERALEGSKTSSESQKDSFIVEVSI